MLVVGKVCFRSEYAAGLLDNGRQQYECSCGADGEAFFCNPDHSRSARNATE
jgi:hypothetical protein